VLERRKLELVDSVRSHFRQARNVQIDVFSPQADHIPIGDQSLATNVNKSAKLRQAPAQRGARIIRDLPKQLAESLAALRSSDHREIGKESTRLLRRRKGDFLVPSLDAEIPQNADLQATGHAQHPTVSAGNRLAV